MAEPWWDAYETRFSNSVFGTDAIGLFALGLVYGLDDLDSLGADIVTGGGDDKKCDLVYIDTEEGRAVIAQCYLSENPGKAAAKSNKAADLNIAVGWLLNANINDVPSSIRPSAEELREAIKDGTISDIGIWYVHNLPESKNVAAELKTAEASALSAIRNLVPGVRVNIAGREIGANIFKQLFEESRAPILVTGKYFFRSKDCFEIRSKEWSSLVTVIQGTILRALFIQFDLKLFSANVRDYLGSRAADANINNGIKETANNEPENFWVYNNGVTALVNDYSVKRGIDDQKISFSGISIVNGAQTTGALGTLADKPGSDLLVPIRFIKTENPKVIDDIIRYNNSQNKVTASDFRSRDAVQRRLKQEFIEIPDTEYEGGRRGGASGAIKRRPSLLPSYTVGQALAAFHGDPVLSYDKKTAIWESDALYSRLFNENTTSKHIVLACSLLRSIQDVKTNLFNKNKIGNNLTQSEQDIVSFFQMKGSIYLLMAAVADLIETILGNAVPNRFAPEFNVNISVVTAMELWRPIVEVLLPLTGQIMDGFTNNRISAEFNASIPKFRALVGATAASNKLIFKEFAAKVKS